LKTKLHPHSFSLKPYAGNSDRLVLDLYDTASAAPASANANPAAAGANPSIGSSEPTQPKPVAAAPAATPAPVKSNTEAKGQRNIIIAVDAGHGGEDPGAIGPKKLYEKHVTLAISKELVAAFNAEPGFTAKLVRTGDYFIPLKKRRDIARNMHADLFVSIHADAFNKPSARGASVFALSRHGATSET